MSSRTILKAAYSNRGPILYVKGQTCFVQNANGSISLLLPILGFSPEGSWSSFLWLKVPFSLEFLSSLPLLSRFISIQHFPRLGYTGSCYFAKTILCAYCYSKQRQSGAEYGTASYLFHHATSSLLYATLITLETALWSPLASLPFWEERYRWSFFSPVWEEISLCLSSSSAIKC